MLEYESRVHELLCEVLEEPECDTVDARADLAPYGMDSLNCMSLVIMLEELFNIEIPEDKLGMRFVRSVYDICELLKEVKDHV